MINRLKNKHIDETAWIIGKGPSLQYLRSNQIGDGIVITINHAILHIEVLELSNKIYSLQKDSVVHIPRTATLLLHEKESGQNFTGYDDHYIFSLSDIGFDTNVFSLAFAVNIAKYMGCRNIAFVSCDLQTDGVRTSYIPGVGIMEKGIYLNQKETLHQYLDGLNIQFFTPANTRTSGGMDAK